MEKRKQRYILRFLSRSANFLCGFQFTRFSIYRTGPVRSI